MLLAHMASRHLAPGTLVSGKYQLVERLGGGGMGEVYRAEHVLAGRTVALKILRPEFADDANLTKRFFQEAQAANKIHHPNIVDVLDAGFSEQGPYVAMECLEGMSLSAALARLGPLPVGTSLAILLPTLDALDAAHRHGIVHRDLKPENIFLMRMPREDRGVERGRSGEVRVKLLDFGIAKVLDMTGGPSPQTHTGIVFGTPDYLSPEQAAGDGIVDGRSDLFAVGIVLFELVTGHRPFESPSAVATAYKIVHAAAPALESFGVHPDPRLQAALDVALAKSPADRFSSAAAFADALAPMVPDGAARREALRNTLERALAVAPSPTASSQTPGPVEPAQPGGPAQEASLADTSSASALSPTERPEVLPQVALPERSALAMSVEMASVPVSPPAEPAQPPAAARAAPIAPTLQSAAVPYRPAPLGSPAHPKPPPPPLEVRDAPPPSASSERLRAAMSSSAAAAARARVGSQPELPPTSTPSGGVRAPHPAAHAPSPPFRESPRAMPVASPRALADTPGRSAISGGGRISSPGSAPSGGAVSQASARGWSPRLLPSHLRGKCHVRGSLPRATSRWIERAFGAPGRNEALQAISAEYAELYRADGFNALVWYDLEALDAFLEAATHTLMRDDVAQWRTLARDNYERDLGPIFRVQQRPADAEALLKRIPSNWGRIYDFGAMRFGDRQWGRLNVKIDDFEGASLALRYTTVGTVEGMMRSGGFSGVAVRVLAGEASFARDFEFEVMWVPKG